MKIEITVSELDVRVRYSMWAGVKVEIKIHAPADSLAYSSILAYNSISFHVKEPPNESLLEAYDRLKKELIAEAYRKRPDLFNGANACPSS